MIDVFASLQAALEDRYRIERELGQGGMATVYLAHDLKHDRDLAIKVLRPELCAVVGSARFLQEIRISARLDHPHILTLIDSGEAAGILYYVLPYVRGESLRLRLRREGQLPLEEALAITRQVASALDYAHQHGVIHRDIKPENILLHEGEAVVTDFGIALAVRQAGGQRLTESGLSLGTPQYMSPEQATGDRELDARSDIYSLAAVLYEMLAGEPPVTGPTVQAMIAKLLTERPTRLRTIRDTVPEAIDAAVAKALAKVPADRFPSAGAFAQALEQGAGGTLPRPARAHPRMAWAAMAVVFLVLAATALWMVLRRHGRASDAAYPSRTQITFTGNASLPAISPDATGIAYVVTDCSSGVCRYGLEVRDLAGGGARRLLDDTGTLFAARWSPDRRFLVVNGSLGARRGAYLIPLLGGSPRFLTPGSATFTPAGDSLLLASAADAWIRIATLDGVARDSIAVQHLGGQLLGALALSDPRWLLIGVLTDAGPESRIIDRRGVERDRVRPGTLTAPRVSDEAAWADFSTDVSRGPLIRLPLDLQRGKFAAGRDTVLEHAGGGFDVTRDAAAIAYVDGTYRFSVWTVGLDAALAGRFEAGTRLLSSTSLIFGLPSPDGRRVLVPHQQGDRVVLSVFSAEGGPGVDIRSGATSLVWATWTRDGRAAYAVNEPSGLRFVAADPQTGATVRTLVVPHDTISAYAEFAALGDSGWAWIAGSRVRVMYPGDAAPRDLPVSGDIRLLAGLQAAPDGRSLGIEALKGESLLVYRMALPAGAATRLAAFAPSINADGSWVSVGRLLILNSARPWSCSLYRVGGPGEVDTLGTIPRPCAFVQGMPDGR
ncbi:MAG: protein kinase domain-containing protein, partial [Gemmatimonadota bacterium]